MEAPCAPAKASSACSMANGTTRRMGNAEWLTPPGCAQEQKKVRRETCCGLGGPFGCVFKGSSPPSAHDLDLQAAFPVRPSGHGALLPVADAPAGRLWRRVLAPVRAAAEAAGAKDGCAPGVAAGGERGRGARRGADRA